MIDHTMALVLDETIAKEQKYARLLQDRTRMKKEAMAKKAGTLPELASSASAPTLPKKKGKSAAINFLDQKLGFVTNPHNPALDPRATASRNLLLYGVSHEGEGRAAYLKLQREDGGPHERYGRPVTIAQEVGWTSKTIAVHQASPFAHRPFVERQFFTSMGAKRCITED
mmetsp:Transcript_43185/g.78539  ORF Transcript_43185/g.78539 Transcript_43185/m.78539 type:complete len:170 (+) Transcript_43185:87-596(+)